MAYWDVTTKRIVHWPDKPIEGYDGWTWRDCGCSGGLQWGGDFPHECRSCGGSGAFAVHVASGLIAAWPGGPALGRLSKEEQQHEP